MGYYISFALHKPSSRPSVCYIDHTLVNVDHLNAFSQELDVPGCSQLPLKLCLNLVVIERISLEQLVSQV